MESESSRVHSYDAPWPTYSLAWSPRPEAKFRIAIGSCIEQGTNQIQVLELNEESSKLEVKDELEHQYPPTKLMWRPDDGSKGIPDMLASTSTVVNLYRMEEGKMVHAVRMANTRTQLNKSGHLPPITSFDWSSVSPHKLGCSSVDTTCTIWNLERNKIESQLIAHDKAVNDIAFSQHDCLFCSVGADGSVRLFDQRNLDHSTIIYEATPPSPLLRCAWNKINTNLIATIAMDAIGVTIIDIRRPSVALKDVFQHEACVNNIQWAPHSRNHLLCGTDDGLALIWDVQDDPPKEKSKDDASETMRSRKPLVAYDADHEVYQVQWPASQPEYVALGMAKKIQVVQI